MKHIDPSIILITSFLLISNNATCMEIRQNPSSDIREIYVINTTRQELKIIFDKGTLPITFRKNTFPAHIPAAIINHTHEHPLINPDGSRLQIPEHLRTNFSYGLFISATNKLQTIPLHKTILYDNDRPIGEQRLRMASDFSNAKTFHVITLDAQHAKSEPIPILDGKIYFIGLDGPNPQSPEIIVQPIE